MRLMHRLAAFSAVAALPVLISPQQPGGVTPDVGKVILVKKTSPDFDIFVNAPDNSLKQWLREHFWRMLVYTPHFDKRSSWYPNGWVYLDSYAIYRNPSFGENVSDLHPEWILRDEQDARLYIPWDCDYQSHTCPQYAADFSHPEFRQWWVDKAKTAVARGSYKGLWIDDVNLDARISNGDGVPVLPIDRNTGQAMMIDDWRRYFAEFLEKVRRDLPGVEIATNSIWYAGGPARDRDPYIQRQIMASDIITIEHGVNDRGITGGSGMWSLNALLAYIDRVNAAGKSVILGGIGSDPSGPGAPDYTIACYFLISNGSNAAGDFGSAITPEKWPRVLDVNLGKPLTTRFSWYGLLRRDFTSGMVLVNPPQSPAVTVPLPEVMRGVDGQAIDSVTLGPAQGVVLLK